MGLLFFFGSLLLLGNYMNPDIQTNHVQTEANYYEFKDIVTFHKSDIPVAEFKPKGVGGIGFNVDTVYRDLENWNNTLSYQYYRDPEYHLHVSTLGMNYFVLRPKTPIRVSIGVDIGIGQMTIYPLEKLGRVKDTPGWGVNSMFSNYFVFNEYLWNFSIRPTYRQFTFKFKGKRFVDDEEIDGSGFNLGLGLGMRF